MHIRAKKSLGQNFLIDREVLEKIVSTVEIANKEILEIGPGSGNLTSYILKNNPKKVFVVEKDDELSLVLKEKFTNQIEIINEDVLKVSENEISEQKLVVFGNLPYNISTEIPSKWIVNIHKEFWFENLVLMFQKEVADRIVAGSNNSKYGRLSILTNWKLNVWEDIWKTSSWWMPRCCYVLEQISVFERTFETNSTFKIVFSQAE